jgi:hypothetical protein
MGETRGRAWPGCRAATPDTSRGDRGSSGTRPWVDEQTGPIGAGEVGQALLARKLGRPIEQRLAIPDPALALGDLALDHRPDSFVQPGIWYSHTGEAKVTTTGDYLVSFVFNTDRFPAKDVVIDRAFVVADANGGGELIPRRACRNRPVGP